jgi:Cys-rich four helix bundle protein (predicted Tat secretion target)
MNRRDLVSQTATLSVLAAAATAAGPLMAQAAKGGNAKLTAALSECIRECEVCLTHCIEKLSEGDKSMANCAASVRECIAMCEALLTVATTKSPRTKQLAALCAATCRDCEKACRQHEKHHVVCKECAEACKRCADACEAVA